MENLSFKKEQVRELVLANRHNHITTTYYLNLFAKECDQEIHFLCKTINLN